MKKVLAIIGSPRKMGNSYKMVKRIEERMRSLGDIEFSYLFLRDANLELCRGCWLCLSVGDSRCPIKDDRASIERQMLDADGVIFASPVYAMNVTALMKNLLDRFAYTLHRPRFFNQRAMIVCTTGALGLKETIDRLSVIRYAGFNLVYSVGFNTPENNVSLKSKSRIDKDVEKAAMKFFDALQDKELPSPNLFNLIAFRAQQTAFSLSHDYNLADCDYNYFKEKGWFEKDRQYYTNAKINPIKNMIAVLIGKVVKRKALEELQGVPWK